MSAVRIRSPAFRASPQTPASKGFAGFFFFCTTSGPVEELALQCSFVLKWSALARAAEQPLLPGG